MSSSALSPSQLADLPIPTTAPEAASFLDACLATLGGGFHVDTPGSDYAAYAEGKEVGPTFTEAEAVAYDARIAATFDLLDDPYETTNRLAAQQPGHPQNVRFPL